MLLYIMLLSSAMQENFATWDFATLLGVRYSTK